MLEACWVDPSSQDIYQRRWPCIRYPWSLACQALAWLCFSQSSLSQPSNSFAELWSAEAGQAVDPGVWVGGRGANMNHAQYVGVQEQWCVCYSCLQWVGECPLSMACTNTAQMQLQSQIGPWFPEIHKPVWWDYSVLEFVHSSLCEPGLQYRLLHSCDQAVFQ